MSTPIRYDGRARLPLSRVNHEPHEPFYGFVGRVVGLGMRLITRQNWGPASIPAEGPMLICANHIANFDPPAVAHFVLWSGRFPRFLAKVELFRVPVIGFIGRQCGQIPVFRNTDKASDALVAARDALAAGRCVVIYPEGTRTLDPDRWPMTGRPGAARLALSTRTPVIPLANWGPHQVTPNRSSKWPRIFPRRTMHVIVGDPVPLDDLYADDPSSEVLAEATHRILVAITVLVAQLRGEEPPPGRWDSRVGVRVLPGADGEASDGSVG